MNAFQPIGEQARWKTVYAILRKAKTNKVVTYDELADALTLNPATDRHAIQMAARRAAHELETEDNRAVDPVPNKGYRIVPAPENLALARRQGKKAGRALARGHSKAIHVDLRGVDPEVRRALELTAQAFSLQMDFNRRFAVKQTQLEQAITEITAAQTADRRRSEDEVAQLRERIERLEHDG